MLKLKYDWPVWAEIACYECGGRAAGRFVWKKPARVAMRHEALSKGWRLVCNEWYCKECLNNLKKLDKVG